MVLIDKGVLLTFLPPDQPEAPDAPERPRFPDCIDEKEDDD